MMFLSPGPGSDEKGRRFSGMDHVLPDSHVMYDSFLGLVQQLSVRIEKGNRRHKGCNAH